MNQPYNPALKDYQQQAAYAAQQISSLQNALAQQTAQQNNMGPSSNQGASNMGSTVSMPNTVAMGAKVEAEELKKIRVRDINIPQARNIVQKVLKTDIVPFLWGPPGVGKSTLVRDICQENEWELIDLRLSLLNPVDLRGLPVVDKEKQLADWYPPAFLPQYNTTKKGLLFLDEINLAPLSVQAAAYQLILDKRVGEYRFPKHWKIIAAGNRETDRANVYKISAPLANRFIHFTVTPDFTTWRDWAVKHIRREVLDFLITRPTNLFRMPTDSEKAFPSPRTWSFLSELLTALDYQESTGVTDDIKQVIVGTIGANVGREFILFIQDYKLQEIARLVDGFINTGNITLPKNESMRYAVISAIFDNYRLGKIKSYGAYESFLKSLKKEELAAIQNFEKENKERLEKQYKT